MIRQIVLKSFGTAHFPVVIRGRGAHACGSEPRASWRPWLKDDKIILSVEAMKKRWLHRFDGASHGGGGAGGRVAVADYALA
jgi:hypothetical protein